MIPFDYFYFLFKIINFSNNWITVQINLIIFD